MKKNEQLIKVEKGKDREYIFEMLTELNGICERKASSLKNQKKTWFSLI